MLQPLAARYILGDELGHGGMAVVYRARDERLGREVAIKLLKAEPPPSQEMLRLFRQEALATSRLTHPNIVNLYDFGELPDGRLYLAMELLAGRSLARVLTDLAAEGRTMPWRRVADIGLQLCAALAAAHERKILHRDLTPANCFRIDAPGMRRDHIKLLDFGIARIREGTLTATLGNPSRDEPIMGTPHYMAPEVLREEPSDHRIDIYSAGVLLYEMSTGLRPHVASNLYALLTAIAEGRSIAPRVRNPNADLTDETEELILRAMHPDPAQRFASANELADALEASLRAATPSSPTPTPTPTKALADHTLIPTRRPSVQYALLLTTAVLLCATIAVYLLNIESPAPPINTALPVAPIVAEPPPRDETQPVPNGDRRARLRALEQQRREEFDQGLVRTKKRRDACLIRAREFLGTYDFPVRVRVGTDGRAVVDPLDVPVPETTRLPDSARPCLLEVLRGLPFAPAEQEVELRIDAQLR
jgi:serine/threonine protein kinase